jgi:hypothetical protein
MVRAARPADDHRMENELMARRELELLIRRAEAEEHLLERRLERLALDQWRARRSIESRLREQPWNRLVG